MSHWNGTAVKAPRRRTGFSMIELVIVVVIIGIIAAIAIPRMSRGAAAAADSALAQNLAILRNALDLYATEHSNAYPTAANVADALTKYTKADGTDANAAKDEAGGRIYGPYLRVLPPISVGGQKGKNGIAAAAADGVAWVYDAAAGTVQPNVDALAKDGAGKLYVNY